MTLLWKIWKLERVMLEFNVEVKVDVYEWMCGMSMEWANAMCLLMDEKRSQDLSGEPLS